MRASIWLAIACFVTCVVCALVGSGYLPLGVRGQWEWGQLEAPSAAADWLLVAILSIVYVGFASLGSRWVENGPGARLLLLTGLVCVAVAIQSGMQQLGFGLGKWPFVLYSSSASGYYTAAKRDVQSGRQFLANYDQIQQTYLERYGPLHLATHPPGLILLQHALIQLCESNRTLTQVLLDLQPRAIGDGLRDVAAGAFIPDSDEAAMWLMALLSQLASAMTLLPIYFLARRGVGGRGAWVAAALWPLVPAMTVFMPKSDVLYPLFAVTSVLCVIAGRSAVGRVISGAAAGIILWFGMFLSFGLISVLPIIFLAAACCEGLVRQQVIRSVVQRVGGVVAAILIASLFLWIATEHFLPATWWRCYRIHASFYEQGQTGSARTYWPWVVFNLAEFAVAAGLPLTIAAITGTVSLLPGLMKGDGSETASDPDRRNSNLPSLTGVVAGWWLTLIALDMSGKNLGEVARLWMFLMPFACIAAAFVLDRVESRRLVFFLLSLQAIQTAAFAANVQGFFDPSSIGR